MMFKDKAGFLSSNLIRNLLKFFIYYLQVRISLEKRLQATVSQLGSEKDGEIQQLQERIRALEQHIENICQQHEEALVRAENDKQQALLIGQSLTLDSLLI